MRLLKQFLYGTFYLLILAGVLWGIYAITLRPAPSCFDNRQNGKETGVDCGGDCVSCEIKNLQPLSLSPAALFSADRNFSASAALRNPNSTYGAKFDYEVNFLDAGGKVLKNITNKGFIYAGEAKSIIEAGGRITTGIPARAEIKLNEESVAWEKPQDFFQPPHKIGELSAVLENEQAVISGNVANLNNYPLSRVIASGFLVDKLGVKIGASKTELQNVGPFRVESFKIFIPVRKDLISAVDLEATAQSVFVEILK
ncbi:MAG: hypothetical protein HYY86_02070 [Candidatus Harrisonbacteria bacterium]|nr:hypothetical protein [Candidatus Harrisonbacteria bacterium]